MERKVKGNCPDRSVFGDVFQTFRNGVSCRKYRETDNTGQKLGKRKSIQIKREFKGDGEGE